MLELTPQVPDELKGRHLHQSFPFNLFMKDMHLDKRTVQRLRGWTMQFVIIRPILSVIAVVLEYNEMYEPYSMYFNIILNLSVRGARRVFL